MKKNGKNINCKNCGKSFYISKSRFGKKKYCSRKCAKEDNYGFVPRTKKCTICGKEFEITKSIEVNKKTCSYECWKENNRRISQKRSKEKEIGICIECGKEYERLKHYKSQQTCRDCLNKRLKKRTGKNNPSYRNGDYQKGVKTGNRNTGNKQCAKYKEDFIEKHGYIFCEKCKISNSPRFEVHHIIFRSEAPNHRNLHHKDNLILCCIQCHNDFHKKKSNRNEIVKERELWKLFPELLYLRPDAD